MNNLEWLYANDGYLNSFAKLMAQVDGHATDGFTAHEWLMAEHVAVSTKPLKMPSEGRWQYKDGEWTAEVCAPKPQNSQSDAPKSEETDEIGASKCDIRDFDDEHAEGRSTEVGKTSASPRRSDGMDSREKLLEDANTLAIDYWDRKRTWGEANDLKRDVIVLLDRQAAITERECREYEDELRKQHHRRLHATKRAIAKAGGTWTEHEDGTVAVVFAPDVDKLEAKLDALKRAVSDAGGMWMEEGGTVSAAFAPDVDELRAERDYWKDQVHRCVIAAVEPGGYTAGVMGYPRDGGYVAPYLLVTDAIDSLKDFYADAKREVAKYQEVVDNQNEVIEDLKAERDQWRKRALEAESKGASQRLNSLRNTLRRDWHTDTVWNDALSVYSLRVDPDVLHPIPDFTRNELYRSSMLERDEIIGDLTAEVEELNAERNKWRDKFGKALDLVHEIRRIAE